MDDNNFEDDVMKIIADFCGVKKTALKLRHQFPEEKALRNSLLKAFGVPLGFITIGRRVTIAEVIQYISDNRTK